MLAASETSESVVVVGVGVVLTTLFSGHDSLQNPQLPGPPICSSSLSTCVEHQYLQMKIDALQNIFFKSY